ncbi:MAG: hypothetical protein GF384_03560, partial [Elusimicrobia bacterium]|nr:hypothetical protein [Elusimicrobiota bacterium]MBD3411990.1 hypothetical protein [Elusimicrobiota bacterium]
LNKWDMVANPESELSKTIDYISVKIPFLAWAPVISISAKTGLRTNKIIPVAWDIFSNYAQSFNIDDLQILFKEISQNKSFFWKKNRTVIKHVRQIKTRPPAVLLEMNHPEMLHFSHKRFIENKMRERFPLFGTPLILHTERIKNKKH